MTECKHGIEGPCELCAQEDREHDAYMDRQAALEQIAASVARALGVRLVHKDYVTVSPDLDLFMDGSNLFNDHWRCRCMDWLLEEGHTIHLNQRLSHHLDMPVRVHLDCPAAEFPARAIAALAEKGEGDE